MIVCCSCCFGCGNTKQISSADLDISEMSDTFVYAQVQQFMINPEDYYDKIIKMSGTLEIYTDPNTKKTYYNCIVSDATACCSVGLEFRLKNNKALSKKFKNGDKITIVGTFAQYQEDCVIYLELKDAEIEGE